jgi:hypothetical protein
MRSSNGRNEQKRRFPPAAFWLRLSAASRRRRAKMRLMVRRSRKPIPTPTWVCRHCGHIHTPATLIRLTADYLQCENCKRGFPAKKTTRLKLFRRVTTEEANRILTVGFEDKTGRYLTEQKWTGVFVSDRPLDSNDGVPLDATVLLEIHLAVLEADIADYEWVEEGKDYREWQLPATMLNTYATVRAVSKANSRQRHGS